MRITLDDVTLFKVIEAVEANAALHAGAHLVDFVLEAPERVGDALIHKVSLPDDSHFAAHNFAAGDGAAGDIAALAELENPLGQ